MDNYCGMCGTFFPAGTSHSCTNAPRTVSEPKFAPPQKPTPAAQPLEAGMTQAQITQACEAWSAAILKGKGESAAVEAFRAALRSCSTAKDTQK